MSQDSLLEFPRCHEGIAAFAWLSGIMSCVIVTLITANG